MPRKQKVTTTYQRAQKTPSKRRKPKQSAVLMPRGLSPMAQYIEDNLGAGISVQELIAQFQEFDCEHTKTEIVASRAETITERCMECRRMQTKVRRGGKNG